MVNLKERNEERRKRQEYDHNLKSRKGIVRDVRAGKVLDMRGKSIDNYTSNGQNEICTTLLAESDNYFKQGKYQSSLENLNKVEKYIARTYTVSPVGSQIPVDQMKYADAIQKRAYRLSNKLSNNPKLDEQAIGLIARIETKYGVHPHSALEKAAASGTGTGTAVAVSIATVIGGLFFFLNPNVTGDVIGNIPTNNSNIIGICLLIAGIAACFVSFRNIE